MTRETDLPASSHDAAPDSAKHVSLREIAQVFFVIGVTGFGGGMAIIALIQDICVSRRKWLTLEEFTHGVAFGQILSAFAVNTTLFVGYRVRGTVGALTAACSFLTPSVIAVIVLSRLYFAYHKLPSIGSALHGVTPVVVALVVSAAWSMGKSRMKSPEPFVLAAIAAVLIIFAKVPILFVLLVAAVYAVVKVKFASGGANAKA